MIIGLFAITIILVLYFYVEQYADKQLLIAVKNADEKLIQSLIQKGANVNFKSKEESSLSLSDFPDIPDQTV